MDVEVKDRRAECTCIGGPNNDESDWTACIAGTVYGGCGDVNCGGVCEPEGACDCPLHESPTHDSGYGGEYSD